MTNPTTGGSIGPGVFPTIPAATVEIVPIKPGVASSELYVASGTIGGLLWSVAQGILPPWVGAVGATVIATGYTVARAWLKVRSILAGRR